MNTKSHTIKQVSCDEPSSFVSKQKKAVRMPAEMTMTDIAKKLRSVYAQMQMKRSPGHLTRQSSVEESFKSYLDDISRAILAEHYIRRKKEKMLFEYLEQIKTLLQNFHNEKKSLEEAAITRHMSRSKSLDSVVHHLANMTCEENQKSFSFQKVLNSLGQNNIPPIQENAVNTSQQGNERSLQKDSVMGPSVEETERMIGHSIIEESHSDIQKSDCCVENNYSGPFLKAGTLGDSLFLRYSVKKILAYLLTIAFMVAIPLCFYSFLRSPFF
ncbi:hypothetical protein [Bartonella doshiae]|uniref:Uncharacterized protein n=2 Tax=Bartonella doshiae TaxID=33044 RepID=A0A380ZEB2_BARDO|nr:hypothetical protein [Bartonella doshiae]EJF81146.1 hypothetical protein MCS_00859 [Bartonella doshiae NCTC 12862 = ATCC 700133]MBB6159979.1 hypothetical protein [Bartonella doshiae]SUV45298.1 Uncharacterised protein [Bartonella doshiae]